MGVIKRTGLQTQASASDTAIEIVAERLELGDPAVEALANGLADLPPVEARGGAALRQAAQMFADILERQAEFLDDEDKAQPPDIAAQEPPLVACTEPPRNA